ncbi:hypothetical protein FRB95_006307 [Tulasnella sp. JGI-2019a]|nr:hypothetical protein FRB95_006307 [Tulasnella sp. JGI-2019a]
MNQLLERLGIGGSSAANASGVDERICTPGTREAILERIKRWIEEPEYDKKHILWLKAVAGSGKTAVAGSVVKMTKDSRCLGARFYFARGQPERNRRCILEISRQFALLSDHRLRDSIIAAIQADPDIPTSPAVIQYQKLILDPLITLAGTDLRLVIVIDAVDECEEEFAVKLLELIGRDHHRLPKGVKFFITSRVEPHIQGELEDESVVPTVEQLSLDAEGSTTVQKDITLYLTRRFPSVVKKFGIRDRNWPGEPKRVELAQMAGESFIWAATAFLLVADPNYRNPVARLEYILSTPSLKNLDYLYSSALERAFPSGMDESIAALVKDVLGALVVARIPLNVTTLASLLMSTGDSAEQMEERIHCNALRFLGSVLTIPKDSDISNSQPVQFLHKSFVDFLVTKGRCDDRLLIHVPEHHEKMAIGCLRRMNDLTRNICQLTDPSKLNNEVEDIAERIDRHIPLALQYACEHWANHLSESVVDRSVATEVDELLEVFIKKMLLFWMEAMGLLGKAKEAVFLIGLAEKWISARNKHADVDPSLLPLVRDAKRFVVESVDVISTSALHIYLSALPFTPPNSLLLPTYAHLLGARPRLLRGGDKEWSSCLWTGSKHFHFVTCIAITPDGKTVVTGSDDSIMRLWDVGTGALLGGPLEGHTAEITCLAWSPDGKVLASGSLDGYVRCWDGETGVAIGEPLEGHTRGVKCLAWASEGKILVSGSADGTLCLWDAKTGGYVTTLEGHDGEVTCLALSPDGQTLVSGSQDSTLVLWDLLSRREIKQLKGHEDKITCLAWSSNERILASGSADRTLRLWDTEASTPFRVLEQTDKVNCLAFAPDSETLGFAVRSDLFLFDSETGASQKPLTGHTDIITCLAFAPDGKTLASGSYDRTLRIWDSKTGTAVGGALQGHSSWVRCLAFTSDSKALASGAQDCTIRVWDMESTAPSEEPPDSHAGMVFCLAFSPGGKILATGSMDKTVRLWNTETGAPWGKPLIGHTCVVICFAFSRDGTILISGSTDRTLRFWDVETGAPIGEPLRGHGFRCLALSPNGRVLASGSQDGTVQLWDVEARVEIGQSPGGHSDEVTCLAWSPSGRSLTSGARDGTVCLWDADYVEMIGTALRGHSDDVTCAAFTPDEMIVISGSDDGTLCLWDTKTGEPIGQPLTNHSEGITHITFALDGKYLVSTDVDQGRLVWDMETRTVVPRQTLKALPERHEDNGISRGVDYCGWLWNDENKRIIWVPAGLRCWDRRIAKVSGTKLAIGNTRVPLIDFAAFVDPDNIVG